MDACDVAEREDRALDLRDNPAEIGGERLGEIAERVDVDATREPDSTGQAASDRRMERPVLVGPHGRGRLARADATGRAARLAAARRLGENALGGLARGERLGVREGHVHDRSFRRFEECGAEARPFRTTPTTRFSVFAAGQPWRARRCT